jgi:hypothetical protein
MNHEDVKTMLSIDLIVWNELACLLEKHPDGNLHAKNSPPWTSRDVYAHLARWLNHNNACIEAYCACKEHPQLAVPPLEMNDRWQKEDKNLTLDEARRKAGVALASRLAAIEAILPDKWDVEMFKLVNIDGASHYAAHINYIVVNNGK